MLIIVNNTFIRVMGAWIGSGAVVQEGLSFEYRLHDQRQLWINTGRKFQTEGKASAKGLKLE